MKKEGITLIILAVIIPIVGFAPIMDVPYQGTETYYGREPYVVREEYTTYGTPQNPIITAASVSSYTFSFTPNRSGVYYFAFDRNYKNIVSIEFNVELEWQETIAERRTEAGELAFPQQGNTHPVGPVGQAFLVSRYVTTLQTYIDINGKSNCLVKGQFTVSATYSPEVDFYVYDETDPSLDEATTYRDVTKYRQVEKQRTVTHYRKGSIYEYLRSGY